MAKYLGEQWTPCPKGELDRLEARLRLNRLVQTLLTAALAVAVAASFFAAAWFVADTLWPSGPTASHACPPVEPADACHK